MQNKKQQKDSFSFLGELTIKKFRDGKEIWRSEPIKNKVVSSSGYGRNLLLAWMSGDTTYPIVINSAAVGDGTTPPADGDTGLESSLVSGLSISNMIVSNNVISIDIFANDGALADDTYSEFGLFCTGRLLSRVLISPSYTKTTGEDTLFSYTLTLTG